MSIELHELLGSLLLGFILGGVFLKLEGFSVLISIVTILFLWPPDDLHLSGNIPQFWAIVGSVVSSRMRVDTLSWLRYFGLQMISLYHSLMTFILERKQRFSSRVKAQSESEDVSEDQESGSDRFWNNERGR